MYINEYPTLLFKPYKLQLVQAMTEKVKEVRKQFYEFVIHEFNNDNFFMSKIVFSNEATFHINGKVNHHNVCIWGISNLHSTIEVERYSPKVNVFCTMSHLHENFFRPFFFHVKTVNGLFYLDMLQIWFLPQLEEVVGDFFLHRMVHHPIST